MSKDKKEPVFKQPSKEKPVVWNGVTTECSECTGGDECGSCDGVCSCVCHEEVDCMNCDQFTWFLNVLRRELFSVKGSDTDRVARMRKLFQ